MSKNEKENMKVERFKIYKDVFEPTTINALWKLITRGIIEGLESPIKIGKESNVFSALTKNKERLAVKIYRIEDCNFKRMYDYLSMDTRFKSQRGRRAIVLTWAKREYRNLAKAYEAGISVPKPIALCDNVLIMEFIGEKSPGKHPSAAPLLKDSIDNPKEMFSRLLLNLSKLYNKTKLVHGDLSEFNILNLNERPVIIDLSHATITRDAGNLFERDVKNICRFFNKFNMKLEPEQLAKEIKGNEYSQDKGVK